ncbi:hypothetical protein D3C72_1510510 [compost metagenome]
MSPDSKLKSKSMSLITASSESSSRSMRVEATPSRNASKYCSSSWPYCSSQRRQWAFDRLKCSQMKPSVACGAASHSCACAAVSGSAAAVPVKA